MYAQYCAMENGKPEDITLPGLGAAVAMVSADTSTIKFDSANVNKILATIRNSTSNVTNYLPKMVNSLDSLAVYSDSLK